MKSAEEFLSIVGQRHSHSVMPTSSMHRIDNIDLPAEICRAADLGWKVFPVRTHSRFAPVDQTRIGYATSDRGMLLQLAVDNPGCNWAIATKESAVVIMEVDSDLGKPSIRFLCQDEWEWRDTLQFRAGDTYFVVFAHPGGRIRNLGSRFAGVKIHSKDSVLIPPSWFNSGLSLTYTLRVPLPGSS